MEGDSIAGLIIGNLDENIKINRIGNEYDFVTKKMVVRFSYSFDEYFECDRYVLNVDNKIIKISESVGAKMISVLKKISKQK